MAIDQQNVYSPGSSLGAAPAAVEMPVQLNPLETPDVLIPLGPEQVGHVSPDQVYQELLRKPAIKNLADELDDRVLTEIGMEVVRNFDLDLASRSGDVWDKKIEAAEKLASLVQDAKDYPFINASHVSFPLVAVAAVQFAARVYKAVIKPDKIVKVKVIGNDPNGTKAKRARRLETHMSYMLGKRMKEWKDSIDKLFTANPVYGVMFRKIYYDPIKKRPVCETVWPKYLVANYYTRDIESAPRLTHWFELEPNLVEERKRAGIYRDVDYGRANSGEALNKGDNRPGSEDKDAPSTWLEQYGWYDLDEDGYKEPYIFTVRKDTQTVARIVARWEADEKSIEVNRETGQIIRIEAENYWIKYPFLRAPDGNFYEQGFGTLIGPINEVINGTVNRLMDAGHLANMQGGFIGRGVKLGRGGIGGVIEFEPGEWKMVDTPGRELKDNIVPLPIKEPSSTLFQLLGLMISAGKELSSVSDVLAGQSPGPEVPATTTLALIEQGMKVFSSIYERIHRSLSEEFERIRNLIAKYPDNEDYQMVLDSAEPVDAAADYGAYDCDVVPVSDPGEVSDIQKLIKGGELMKLAGKGLNDIEIIKNYLTSLDIDEIEKYLPDPKAQKQPDPELVIKMREIEIKEREQRMREAEFALKHKETEEKILLTRAQTTKTLADAEAVEPGEQMSKYQSQIEGLKKLVSDQAKVMQGLGAKLGMKGMQDEGANNEGGVPSVAGAPGNGSGLPPA